MFSPLYFMWKLNHTSVVFVLFVLSLSLFFCLSLSFFLYIYIHSYIYLFIYSYIHISVDLYIHIFIYICIIYIYIYILYNVYIHIHISKFLMILFARKNFYQAKRVSLQLEIWEGTVRPLMRSRWRSSDKTWKVMRPRRKKSHFQSLWCSDWNSCYGFFS